MVNLHLSENSSALEVDVNDRSIAKIVADQDKARLRQVVVARIDGILVDLSVVPTDGDEIFLVAADSPEGLEVLRHSAAHVMAEAVKSLFPNVKVTIGPAIKDGFYYDFDFERPFTLEDLKAIEKKMKALIKEGRQFRRREVTRQEALALFAGMGEDYKVELINELADAETISLYESGNFVDLCRGPHLSLSLIHI